MSVHSEFSEVAVLSVLDESTHHSFVVPMMLVVVLISLIDLLSAVCIREWIIFFSQLHLVVCIGAFLLVVALPTRLHILAPLGLVELVQ